MLIPNQAPIVVYVRVPFTDSNFRTRPRCPFLPSEFPQDTIPIFRTKAKSSYTINLNPPRSSNDVRQVKLQPLQFPFVCSLASTVYKVQGRSINTLVVANWKSLMGIINKPQQIYLIVSRPTKRSGLATLDLLTQDICNWAKPSVAALNEDMRLIKLAKELESTYNFN